MAKNTSILLGAYFENFIKEQVDSGRFSSVSEVVRTALRFFEQEESKKKAIVSELIVGEKSGFKGSFDRKEQLKTLHEKHLNREDKN